MHRAWLWPLLFGFAGQAMGADIGVTGSWTETVDKNDLVAGAGSNIRSPIESATNQVTLAVTNTGAAAWTVNVSRSDISWPAGVGISVKRTSDGTGTGTITGGTAYQAVGTGSASFFSGNGGDRSDIQIQLKTEGLSVTTSPAVYSLTVTYTVTQP